MKPTHAILLVAGLSWAGLVGCNDPSGAPTISGDPAPSTQTGSQTTQPGLAMDIEVDEPTPSRPLTAGAALTPAKVKPGETATFTIRAKTANTWHIYALDHAGIGVPTNLELELPDGLEVDGEWVTPEAKPYPSAQPSLVFEGDLTFQHSLKIAANAASGQREVKCKFGYQTCNESFCNPPTSLELSAMLEVE